ncbi:FAD-dependent monooxygenase [Sinomonas sp. P47F7]|uniref:FAD-dependent monooxygenase n=1 Tax=Sinomonas sp. P47F7 TaxID=3410987 RepID=UPI003BF49111
MNDDERAVVIVGAGPTGMMLAGELALAGVDVAIVERREDEERHGSRAGGLHARTIEIMDQRGIADRFLAEGQTMQIQGFAGVRLDLSDFPTRHPYGLALGQDHSERILATWVEELGVRIERGCEVLGFTADDGGVVVELSGGRSLRAAYLVGCDGGRSLIRKSAGIDFPGWDPSVSSLIAEVELRDEPEWGVRHDDNGTQAIGPTDDGKRVRMVVSEKYVGQTLTPTLEDVSRALISVWGTDFGVHSPIWISRFTDMTRQAASYRAGRVLLAGDAAHIHYPVGGQGLNLGVQDAVNLGWKLAQVVNGTSPESLLDTYQAERYPVAARVLQSTMAQTALTRSDARIEALRGFLTELLEMDEPRKRFAAMSSGLDIRYDIHDGLGDDIHDGLGDGLGDGHPLLGHRMPDLELNTAEGPVRMFALLHSARPVFVNFGGTAGLDITPWADRVDLMDAVCRGRWELPVLGEVADPEAVLIRPDGYVAWAGAPSDPGLPHALTAWFGMPAAA